MIISSTSSVLPGKQGADVVSARKAPTVSPSQETAETAASNVSLSEVSRRAALAPSNATERSGDIDMARVQRVVEAIHNGQYAIDPSKIADGWLADMRELLKSGD